MRLRATVLVAVVSVAGANLPAAPALHAQGVTTAEIQGEVRSSDGSSVNGTRFTLVQTATGFVTRGEVVNGRFLIHGLESGGPYTITLRRVGFRDERREGIFARLGEPLELHVVMRPEAIALDTLRVAIAPPRVTANGGTGTGVSDSLLHRLPSLNRNLYDFVRLAPQVSTRIGFAPGGMSGGGAGFRFNSFLANGVPQRSVGGHVPPEFAGSKSVPLGAVKEYQILLAPFDVKYGDFGGALVNAVTRSGSNEFEGSVFGYARGDALARPRDGAAAVPYERLQYGVTAGGPLWRDRLHFLVAMEGQHLTSEAAGPYVGQPEAAPDPVPVSEADLGRIETILRGYGLVSGSGGAVENRNPQRSVFARLDAGLAPWNSRAVLWVNDSRAGNLQFSRPVAGIFPLSTTAATQSSAARNASLQLHTALGRRGGGHNELLVSYRRSEGDWRSDVRQPMVRVVTPGAGGGSVTVVSGTPQHAHGSALGGWAVNLRDDLALPLGASHVASFGFEAERFGAEIGGLANAYGTWDFSSLDSLARGVAARFEVAQDLGSANAPMSGVRYAAYAGDRWRVDPRLSVTLGVRAELVTLDGRPPYNPAVDSIFGRRTDIVPRRYVDVSPRVGFTWDLSGNGRSLLRGGAGLFTGRAPGGWLHAAYYSYGDGIGVLRCGGRPTDRGASPAFAPSYLAPPVACAGGGGPGPGDVVLLDPELRPSRSVRGVLAYERRLPWELLGTVEALLTRHVSDFVFVNLNLEGPQAVDGHGRVLYGSIGQTGVSVPALRSDFAEVIALRNTSANHAYQLSGRIERSFSGGVAGSAHYTFSRVRDVQTPLRIYNPASTNWASRAVAGRHEDLRVGRSLNDVPHRFVLAGTVRAPWRGWTSEFSFLYAAESGNPFTYLAWGAGGARGDLNADGSNVNDPIYVPHDAGDAREIRFASFTREVRLPDGGVRTDTVTAARQVDAFERFIDGTPCLRRERGRIATPNGCREPSAHTTIVSFRQALPLGGRTVEVQADAYNVLNLASRRWGLYRAAVPALLEHVGHTGGAPDVSQPIFRFDPDTPRWVVAGAESTFQLQLGLRYRF